MKRKLQVEYKLRYHHVIEVDDNDFDIDSVCNLAESRFSEPDYFDDFLYHLKDLGVEIIEVTEDCSPVAEIEVIDILNVK